jgi:DNA-binding XRE family transcriptional regulator
MTEEEIRWYVNMIRRVDGAKIEWMANMSGINKATIGNFLNGKTSPTLYTAIKILDSLGLEFQIQKKKTRGNMVLLERKKERDEQR